jgi:hypothetical protein
MILDGWPAAAAVGFGPGVGRRAPMSGRNILILQPFASHFRASQRTAPGRLDERAASLLVI